MLKCHKAVPSHRSRDACGYSGVSIFVDGSLSYFVMDIGDKVRAEAVER